MIFRFFSNNWEKPFLHDLSLRQPLRAESRRFHSSAECPSGKEADRS